jgi:hypothetical protein
MRLKDAIIEKLDWIMEQNHSRSIKDICLELGFKSDYVLLIIRQYGLQIRHHKKPIFTPRVKGRNQKIAKYTLDETRFNQIDNEHSAYWLGFCDADGSIGYYESGPKFTIQLQKKDESHLEKFRNWLGYNGPIRQKICGKSNTPQVNMSFCSRVICDNLSLQGCIPRKTYYLDMPPNLSDELFPHFLRGIFDGDGTITFSNDKYRYGRFGLAGYPLILDKIASKLNSILGVRQTKATPNNSNISKTDGFVIKYGSQEDVRKIRDYMYKSATVWLERKRDRLELV